MREASTLTRDHRICAHKRRTFLRDASLSTGLAGRSFFQEIALRPLPAYGFLRTAADDCRIIASSRASALRLRAFGAGRKFVAHHRRAVSAGMLLPTRDNCDLFHLTGLFVAVGSRRLWDCPADEGPSIQFPRRCPAQQIQQRRHQVYRADNVEALLQNSRARQQ